MAGARVSDNGVNPAVRVSALVSTYNSERFFVGCIDDLLRQTLYERGELEIVVVNAGSKQDEAYHIREYLRQGIPLTVITSLREPLYSSWNRAAKIASGQYLTSTNTDDRHNPNALEILADTLDANPATGLVYADCYVTPTANAVWGETYEANQEPPYGERFGWPPFDPLELLRQCYIGPQPMWRKSLHAQYGYFDTSYLVAGDYEFWLRLAANGVTFQRVEQMLGLFYWNPEQMGRAMQAQSAMESRRALLKYRHAMEARWEPSPT